MPVAVNEQRYLELAEFWIENSRLTIFPIGGCFLEEKFFMALPAGQRKRLGSTGPRTL